MAFKQENILSHNEIDELFVILRTIINGNKIFNYTYSKTMSTKWHSDVVFVSIIDDSKIKELITLLEEMRIGTPLINDAANIKVSISEEQKNLPIYGQLNRIAEAFSFYIGYSSEAWTRLLNTIITSIIRMHDYEFRDTLPKIESLEKRYILVLQKYPTIVVYYLMYLMPDDNIIPNLNLQ